MDEKIVKDSQGLAKDLVNDTISRRLAIDKFAAYIYHAFKDFYRIGLHRKTLTPEQCRRVARNVLAEVPSAQPERRKGRWRKGVCECGYDWAKDAPISSVPNFCPQCGADMRGEQE